MDEKRCTKCGEVKPVGEFNKRTGTKDGLDYQCIACRAKRRRKYRRNKNIKHVDACIDSNLHKELKREAFKYSMSISQLLTGMVYFYFDNYKD